MLHLSLLAAGLLTSGLTAVPTTEAEIHHSDSLEAATVSVEKGITVSRKETILTQNTITLSEALASSAALQVNDNGGLAGIKSVSLRGLGSAHTNIYIDGIRSANVQSGQNDLGMFDLTYVSSIIIDYAQNSININTERPTFENCPIRAKVRMYGGSFGTYLPSMRLDFRVTDKIALSANASGTFSEGNYPNGDNLKRINNDIRRIRTGVDMFGKMSIGNYHIKASYIDTERGTPGSLEWPSDDRQADMNAYLQGSTTLCLSDLYTLRLSTKGSFDKIYYTSVWGDSSYGQTEVQLNSVQEFRITDWWRLSFAADFTWDNLKSTSYNMDRFSCLTALASTFTAGKFAADIALEYCLASDKGQKIRDAFSPSANLRYVILDGLEIMAFGRRMYRIPVFNELYYTGYGNPELLPEDAWTWNIGADLDRQIDDNWKITGGLHGFYTTLTDKIISAPTEEDPNIWMPINIGKVCSAGFDAKAGTDFTHGKWIAGLNVGYSYLSSIDRTPDSYSYGSQVPYTSRHSLSASGKLNWDGWEIAAAFNLRSGYAGSAGPLPDWNTTDITLSKVIKTAKAGSFCLKLTSRNIGDNRYELVAGYPMPGRSFIGGIEYQF